MRQHNLFLPLPGPLRPPADGWCRTNWPSSRRRKRFGASDSCPNPGRGAVGNGPPMGASLARLAQLRRMLSACARAGLALAEAFLRRSRLRTGIRVDVGRPLLRQIHRTLTSVSSHFRQKTVQRMSSHAAPLPWKTNAPEDQIHQLLTSMPEQIPRPSQWRSFRS